jgi:uncharacterized coiled-coil DUF342 family protein
MSDYAISQPREGRLEALSRLADQAEEASRREREVRERLHQAHVQLAERDDQIARLVDLRRPTREDVVQLERECEKLRASSDRLQNERFQLLSERERLAAELDAVQAALKRSEHQLAALTATRVWRIAGNWWRLRDRILGR